MLSLSSPRSVRHRLITMRPEQWMPEACSWPYSSGMRSLGLLACTAVCGSCVWSCVGHRQAAERVALAAWPSVVYPVLGPAAEA